MKKLLCMALCFLLVFSLCACGGKDDASADVKDTDVSSNDTVTETENEAEESDDTSVPEKFVEDDGTIVRPAFLGDNTEIKSSTAFENDVVQVSIYAFSSYDADKNTGKKGAACLTLKITNKTDKVLYFELQDIALNGLSMGTSEKVEIDPKDTYESTNYYPDDTLAESGIYKIYNGKVYFWAKADGEEKDYYETISFETNKKGEQVNYTEGETVYEKDGIKVILQNTGWVNDTEYEVGNIRFFVENNSDKKCKFYIEKMTLEGSNGEVKEYDSIRVANAFNAMSGDNAYFTYWIDMLYPEDAEEILPLSNITLEIEAYVMDMNTRALSGKESFTVKINGWDWSKLGDKNNY